MGYVDKGNGQKEKIFNALQNYLLSADAQKEMISKGRRNKLLAMDPSLSDKKAFNPEYGFDVERVIAPIQPPREEVLSAILDLYQEEVRKPSATFWVIDDSGSMYNNNGKKAVQQAMSILLTPEKAREYKLQPTPRDIHVVIPFSDTPGLPITSRITSYNVCYTKLLRALDLDGFDAAMAEQKARSKSKRKFAGVGDAYKPLTSAGVKTVFKGYDAIEMQSDLLIVVKDDAEVDSYNFV